MAAFRQGEVARGQEQHVSFDFYLNSDEISAEQRRLCVDLALGHACIVVRLLSGGRVKPERVRLHSDRPPSLQHYRRVFGAALEFNADTDSVLLPAGALELAFSGSNPSLHEAMRLQLDTVGAAPSRVQEVRTHTAFPTPHR